MTGCCVHGCVNTSDKGFSMRCFPTDNERRAVWVANIKRPYWEPTKSSRICEAHFADEMWEKVRCDGKRKLRANAVPTIFQFCDQKSREDVSSENNDEDRSDVISDNLANEKDFEDDLERQSNSDDISGLPILEYRSSESTSESTREETNFEKQCRRLRHVMKKREELFCRLMRKSDRYRGILKERLIRLKEDHQRLKKQHQSCGKLKARLKRVFTEDQIEALDNQSRGCKWSDDTIKRAIRLRLACGSDGYQEILKQNIPVPSERTLRRRLESIEFEGGICEDVLNKLRTFSDEKDKRIVYLL